MGVLIADTVTQDEKLKMYGLFKQSKEGDVNTGEIGVNVQRGAFPAPFLSCNPDY